MTKYTLELTGEEKRAIALALNCQICYIETGDVAMSAESARQTGQEHLIKDLAEAQYHTLVKLRKLYAKVIRLEALVH
jgi:hypothetical protein